MLGSMDIVAFVPTRNRQKARPYYEKTLGLSFVSDDQFALVFDANGVTVRVVDVSTVAGFEPAPFTILGWSVGDISKTVKGLGKKGVKFERYPGMQQDQIGVWKSPSGAKVAWFKDPDGNVLSVTES
jgi:catechol 2,3-dioxygenase-like lactoylglutathione lyase family enzyme